MSEQEKLNILVGNFSKLEESRKDYIRDLTRKLAEIHSGGSYMGMVFQEMVPHVQNIHYM